MEGCPGAASVVCAEQDCRLRVERCAFGDLDPGLRGAGCLEEGDESFLGGVAEVRRRAARRRRHRLSGLTAAAAAIAATVFAEPRQPTRGSLAPATDSATSA